MQIWGTEIYECVEFSAAWLNFRGLLGLSGGMCSTVSHSSLLYKLNAEVYCTIHSSMISFICSYNCFMQDLLDSKYINQVSKQFLFQIPAGSCVTDPTHRFRNEASLRHSWKWQNKKKHVSLNTDETLGHFVFTKQPLTSYVVRRTRKSCVFVSLWSSARLSLSPL